MSTDSYDVAIIGGGIIGLATAMRLTEESPRLKVAVVEKEDSVCLHQTGHNSGVIHAGIYYTPGSSKANFCATGARMLREFCEARGLEYELCGKVIVATRESEVAGLEELYRRGTANGAKGLRIVDRDRLSELEPHAAGIKAVHSPNTGIIDYSTVCRAYADTFQENGGRVLLGARLNSAGRRGGATNLETTCGDVAAKHVINCGGLYADRIARMMGAAVDVRIIPFRGEYFTIRPERAHLVRGLIYPVPNPKLPFLGAHFTKRITGGVEAGPNAVLALAREGYTKTAFSLRDVLDSVGFGGFWRMGKTHWLTGLREQYSSLAKGKFLRSLQRLVPDVTMDDLAEPGSGVRAQAVDRHGNLLQDFSITATDNAIHVLNAPSPGATSSLAIGKHIAGLARDTFRV